MTFEELNIVRRLKKQIDAENKKLRALKIVLESMPHKYCKSEEVGSGGVGKSPFEIFAVQIIDTENKIAKLQADLTDSIPKLTKKIQETFSDSTEQTLLIYRYVSCEYFRDIGFLMGYSENWVYWKHNQLLKSLELIKVDCS